MMVFTLQSKHCMESEVTHAWYIILTFRPNYCIYYYLSESIIWFHYPSVQISNKGTNNVVNVNIMSILYKDILLTPLCEA